MSEKVYSIIGGKSNKKSVFLMTFCIILRGYTRFDIGEITYFAEFGGIGKLGGREGGRG